MATMTLLLVTIGGEAAAIDTRSVKSVIELETVTPVPGQPAHVEGLAALRSSALVVIDCRRALDLPEVKAKADGGSGPQLAVVVEVEGFLHALIVDAVADVVAVSDDEMAPVRARLGRGWARVSRAMVGTAAGPAQLIDVASLIAGPEQSLGA